MKQLIFSIISAQTIPNIQVIKEFRTDNTTCIFLCTPEMHKRNIHNWIADACNLQDPTIVECPDEYNIMGIRELLSKVDYDFFDKIIINLTGGTKLMSMAVFDFFKGMPNCTMLYVPAKPKITYHEVYPNPAEKTFQTHVSLKEYLKGYGFKIKERHLSGIDIQYTANFCKLFCNSDMSQYEKALSFMRSKRDKGLRKEDEFQCIESFLTDFEFHPERNNRLSPKEVKYLTGDWFEEYIYDRIKKELQILDEDIMTGVELAHNNIKDNEILYREFLGDDIIPKENTKNEFDILFIRNNTLYYVECKTSIINKEKDYPSITKDLEKILGVTTINIEELREQANLAFDKPLKNVNILTDTIYKVDSLRSKFGLYASSHIFTLTDFKTLENTNKAIMDINRATLAHITISDRQHIIQEDAMKKIFK